MATTSCEVMPAALSTSRTPSRVSEFMINGGEHSFFNLCERAFDTRTGGERVAAAAEGCANLAHVNFRILRAKADADFSFGEFLEERRDDHAFDCADRVDQTFVVLRFHAQRGARGLREREAGDAIL